MPSSSSRDIVQVLLRDKRSMRRSVSPLKRPSAVSGTYSTFAVSPSTAAATALQKSTSKPRQTPDPSFSEKPGSPSLTPQINLSLDRTSSSVPAAALSVTTKPSIKNTTTAQNTNKRFRSRSGNCELCISTSRPTTNSHSTPTKIVPIAKNRLT